MPHAHAEAGASELAARVCHEEQMTVWSGEIMGTLSIGGYLREDWSYEDTIGASAAVAAEIRSIVESAFDHPELKGAALAPAAVPKSVRRLIQEERPEAAEAALEWALSLLATPSSVQAGEARHVAEVELQEIADGAYGNDPLVRGLARNRLTKNPSETWREAPGSSTPNSEQRPGQACIRPQTLRNREGAPLGDSRKDGFSGATAPASVGAEEETAPAVKTLGVEPGETAFRAYYEHGGATWENLSLLGRRQWTRVEVALARRARPAGPAPASAGAVPEGWRLVPVELTNRMLEDGGQCLPPTSTLSYCYDCFREAWAAALAAAATPDPAAGGREIVRHLKRGTEYEVLHQGVELQVAVARGEPRELLETTLDPDPVCWEGDKLVIYRGADGKMWAREESEFRDGRFETASESRSTLSASTADGETAGDGLSLTALHAANIARQAEWCPDQVPDLSFRGNELAGETGEACNVIKKLERERQGWRGSRASKADLAEELADVVICADLCAVTAGIDLSAAVIAKFNGTSEKQGLSTRLPTPTRPDATAEDATPATSAEGR